MSAYCTVLGLRDALLLYPRHNSDIDQRLAVRGSHIRIHEMSIDLRESRHSIDAEYRALARHMIAVALSFTSPQIPATI